MKEPRKFPAVLTGVMLFLMGESKCRPGNEMLSQSVCAQFCSAAGVSCHI